MIVRTALAVSLAALVACAGRSSPATPAAPPPTAATPASGAPRGVDLAAMDPAIRPGDDFYL